MNNKLRGNYFENEICSIFAQSGWWVHFLSPDRRGAQPFDILVAKDHTFFPIDCKTCKSHIFSISRLEDNQVMAFEKWIAVVGTMPYIYVEHDGKVYALPYSRLCAERKIDLDTEQVLIWLNDRGDGYVV